MPKYGNQQSKSFTVTWPARGIVPQVAVTVSAQGPERAVTVAAQAAHDSLAQTPTVT